MLALFFGYSQLRQLTQEEIYSLIGQYREYRLDLQQRESLRSNSKRGQVGLP